MGEVSSWGAIASVAGGITLAGVLEYFNLSYEVASIFVALLALDFIFWIGDAFITDRDSVTSTKAWQGLVKKACKLSLPLIVVLVLKWVGFENLEMVITTIISILIVTEGYSIIGHIYSISAWKTIPEIDAMAMLVEFIISVFKWKLPDTKEEIKEKKDEEI